MAITTSKIGSNTTLLSLSGETNSDGFIAALDAAIVAGGWAQHDISNPMYRVYKAVNIDNQTYKYAAISIDRFQQRFWLTSWESWNEITHVGTNETFTHHGGYWQPYTFNWCDVAVFAHPRWLGFQVYIRNTPAPHPVFVMETTRDHPEDTAAQGIPCWGWMTPAATSEPIPYMSGNSAAVFSTPRTKSGLTGISSAKSSFIATMFNRVGTPQYSTTSATVPTFGNGLSSVAANTSSNVWNSNAVYASTMRVGHRYSELQGRIVGAKISNITGAGLLNRVNVPVGSNFMYDATGSQTEHWAFPFNSDRPVPNITSADTLNMTGSLLSAAWNGQTIFGVTNTRQIVRYDIDARSATNVGTLTNSAASNGGMVFDGRYCYIAGGDRIIKWDTTNDTLTESDVSASMTTGRLCFDGVHIWAADHAPIGSNLIVRKYDTNLNFVTSIPIAVSNNGTGHTTAGIACDTFGNIVVYIVDSTSIFTSVHKINASSDTLQGKLQFSSDKSSHGYLNWMGVPGVFDVAQVLASSSTYPVAYRVIDASKTAPVNVADQPPTTMYLSNTTVPSGNGSPTSVMPRYGRTISWVSTSPYAFASTDYDTTTSTQINVSTGVLAGLRAGAPIFHFGTHVLTSTASAPLLAPSNAIYQTSLGGQLLLPK